MQTLPAKVWNSLIAVVIGCALMAFSTATSVQAQRVTSDEPAGYLIFPKIVVDVTGVPAVDTLIQLTNTSDQLQYVNCWYVDGTRRCSIGGAPCSSDSDCPLPGACAAATCAATDMTLQLTPDQPVAWRASTGLQFFPCDPDSPACDEADGPCSDCRDPQAGSIPPVGYDTFQGELKCVQIVGGGDPPNDSPKVANDLKGEATIYRRAANGDQGPVSDTSSYNAIGVQSLWGQCSESTDARCADDEDCPVQAHCSTTTTTPCDDEGDCPATETCEPGETCRLGTCSSAGTSCGSGADCPTTETCDPINNGDNVLRLGGPDAEYAGCPAVLIVDHFFDGAESPINDANSISSDITLVPCTENVLSNTANQAVQTTAQMLVYNEFEQRFSTSRRITCFDDRALSDIDTRDGSADNQYSLFYYGVQGTLGGQTRVRGVQTQETDVGHGLLAVTEEFHKGETEGLAAAAINVGKFASREQGDVVTLSVPLP